MTTQQMIETIAKYFETLPVQKAWLFGSFAIGEEKPWSDVDILFVPDRSGKPFTLFTMGGMYMDLKELLGRERAREKKQSCQRQEDERRWHVHRTD